MAETQMPKNDHSFMGKFLDFSSRSTRSVDGRFLMWSNVYSIAIIDLFHKQTRILRIDFSSASIEGSPLTVNKSKLWIQDSFVLNSTTVLLLYRIGSSCFLGIGEIDFNRSTIVIKQTVNLRYYSQAFGAEWFPLSYPPDLYNGVVCGITHPYHVDRYLIVQMQTNDQLRVSEMNLPTDIRPIGFFDGCLYGLSYDQWRKTSQPIDLVKHSITTGERTQEQTIDWEIVEFTINSVTEYMDVQMCCVGRTLFVKIFSEKERKDKIVSLDLDILKWDRSTTIKMDNSADLLLSDGERTLIVCTHLYNSYQYIHRFVLKQPDKLSNLVWLRLKRIFDNSPEFYEFILSQLPTNFKQKCLFAKP